MEKVSISEETKRKIVENAGKIAAEIGLKILACAPATLHGIYEAFRAEGIELMPPETEGEIFKGMIGLFGGPAMTGIGTCGAVNAACFLISHITGVSLEDMLEDRYVGVAACIPGATYIVGRFERKWGTTECLKLRYLRTGRADDFLDPDGRFVYDLLDVSGKKCAADVEHPVIMAARWGAEAICDLLSLEPEKRKAIPEDLKPTDKAEIERKIVPLLKEFGFPSGKKSYRNLEK